MAQTEVAPRRGADALPDRKIGQRRDGKTGGKAKSSFEEGQRLRRKNNIKRGKIRFKEEKRGPRSGVAAGNCTTSRVVEGFEGLEVLGIDERKPSRRSVRKEWKKKGAIDRF